MAEIHSGLIGRLRGALLKSSPPVDTEASIHREDLLIERVICLVTLLALFSATNHRTRATGGPVHVGVEVGITPGRVKRWHDRHRRTRCRAILFQRVCRRHLYIGASV